MKKKYNNPSAEIILLRAEGIVCASNGDTQDYNSQSIWNQGSDNE